MIVLAVEASKTLVATKELLMKTTCRFDMVTGIVLGVRCLATPLMAQKTVKINFDSAQTYKDSYGTQHTAALSGLNAESRAAIIAKAQEKFDTALGQNQLLISEGAAGDISVIMSAENY